MLTLTTHEPHFRLLPEDVFFQEGSPTACRICGQEGHYAAQCTRTKAEIKKKPPPENRRRREGVQLYLSEIYFRANNSYSDCGRLVTGRDTTHKSLPSSIQMRSSRRNKSPS